MYNIFDEINSGTFNISSSQDDSGVSDESLITEATGIEKVDEIKTIGRKVILPQGKPVGKGNLAFLYANTVQESIDTMVDNTNLLDNKKYKYFYYNLFYQGKLNGKMFRFKDKKERENIYKSLPKGTKIIPRRQIKSIGNDNRNMYYDLSKYISIFTNICSKLQPKKYISLYWTYFKNIYSIQINGYTNKFVIVNLKYFYLSNKLKENLENPLYMIYYTLYKDPSLITDLNMDFYFYLGNKVLRINPSHCNEKSYKELRVQLRRIMRNKTTVEVMDNITSEEKIKEEEITATAISNVIQPITSDDKSEVIKTDTQLKKMKEVTPVEKEVTKSVQTKVKKLAEKAPEVIQNAPPTSHTDKEETVAKAVETNVKKEIDEDREMLNKIYYQNVSSGQKQRSRASTARDKLIEEEQKNIHVGDKTIGQLEKIKAEDIPIDVHDVSKNVRTANENMKQIKFANLDKEYNKKLMNKDITSAILSLNDKSIPMYILKVDIKDTSDELNYKDTYTILLEDSNRKRHTIKVDIPKFMDDRFLYIGGNKKIIKHQNFLLPIVKTSPSSVQIVSNYSKMTVTRNDNKSTSSVERLKKLISKDVDGISKYFKNGVVYGNNKKYITTLEYDTLSKSFAYFKNTSQGTYIMFDQNVAHEYMKKHNIKEKTGKIFIGTFNNKNAFIDANTQEDENGNGVVDMIVSSLPQNIINQFDMVSAPKRLVYTSIRIMSKDVYTGMLLGLWEGISSIMKRMNIKYRLEKKAPKNLSPDENYLVFKDCTMVYKEDVNVALIMNSFRMIKTNEYNLADFDDKIPYIDYIRKVYGKAIIENALTNFYEFFMDPITKEVCQQVNLPTDIMEVIIYAVKLLADTQYQNELNQNLSRVRCNEIIPAILYERLAKNYINYRTSNGKKAFSVPRDCVIKEILGLKTVEDYSTLNPTLEMEQIHAISSKGFSGINLDDYYTLERRGYDPSMIGIISPSTSPDGNVGVSKTLTLEPDIKNLRGFIEDKHDKLDELNDTNLFSPGELTMPLAATIDDATRLGHAIKQSKHVIPVKDSAPVLISNGIEEVARFHLTSNFVINAEESGEIVDYDPKANILIAKYKSGKCKAIDLSPNIVKNAGGGFFLSNKLVTDLKVGDKFKKDDVLAYHKDFFKNDKYNNCRMVMGTLTKVAIMSTYNTYEDSTFITHKLSERCATEMVFCKQATVGKNSNVFYMVHKGQEVNVGDPLIQFDTSFDDDSINALLANLNDESKNEIMQDARNDILSKYSGVIEDIKIYSTVDLEEMNPTLRKIVADYYRDNKHKREFLNKYDDSGNTHSVVKCGVLVTEPTHKVEPNKFGVIKGAKVEDGVLIEFYIKHSEPLEVGSKIANFTKMSVVK